jgi:hypothetical protein
VEIPRWLSRCKVAVTSGPDLNPHVTTTPHRIPRRWSRASWFEDRDPFERTRWVDWNSRRKIPHKIPHTRSTHINHIDKTLTKSLQSKDYFNEINRNNTFNRTLNP